MQTTALEAAPIQRLSVVVGILRARERVLLQQRIPGTPCAGQWEFPGGKIESGESPHQALERELREELGVESLTARVLMELPFDYAHARVLLNVFLVDSFTGEVTGREGQQTRWLKPAEIRRLDVLGAVHPILNALDGLGRPGPARDKTADENPPRSVSAE